MIALLNHLAVTCTGNEVLSPVDNSCMSTGLPTTQASSYELKLILSIIFAILGAISVLFVVIGGFRYTISGGDPQDMQKAKGTIMYAVIGLVVAIIAEAIVTFVLSYIT